MVLPSVLGDWQTKHKMEFAEEETDWSVPFMFFSLWDFVLSG